jgi:hypothetical protein
VTAEALAAFADRPIGKTYGVVCSQWGIDPAAGIDDDVLAFNLRAALTLRMNEKPPDEAPVTDPFEETRKAAEKVRQWQQA